MNRADGVHGLDHLLHPFRNGGMSRTGWNGWNAWTGGDMFDMFTIHPMAPLPFLCGLDGRNRWVNLEGQLKAQLIHSISSFIPHQCRMQRIDATHGIDCVGSA